MCACVCGVRLSVCLSVLWVCFCFIQDPLQSHRFKRGGSRARVQQQSCHLNFLYHLPHPDRLFHDEYICGLRHRHLPGTRRARVQRLRAGQKPGTVRLAHLSVTKLNLYFQIDLWSQHLHISEHSHSVQWHVIIKMFRHQLTQYWMAPLTSPKAST